MDRGTRNRIQRATQAARQLLEHEYAEQLEGVFDIRLDGMTTAEPGEHLDAAQRVLRTKLVTAVEHQRASGMTKADAVASYLREAAFTTLNRFVALKMLEARELVQECISRGDQSAGFKEFTGLAPGLVQVLDHGYRLYIESLFDEIGREVRVLFDRRDPASLLWPRRQARLDLLGILNAPELAPVWGEDETIGWVYQYFNSDDERKQMRAESQAPRNSRELAVRNQFFTPRYVVQFLTDNTVGRIWHEMRQGETRLSELDYLVRRPNEVFLGDGDEPPPDVESGDTELTQEELLQRPAYVRFRAKKDPRDIRVLDPACGSGHFLLYAFDLLLTIYEEAWADEKAPPSKATGRSLPADYKEIEMLHASVPGLILRHNLYGSDIDPRCAQIAALALWMRAKRALKDLGISRDAPRTIQNTNVVVAEPMPGDREPRREFVATLELNLSPLVERVFDRMELAGEAGSLLRIEDEIREVVQANVGEHGDLFRATDEERWRQAEDELLRALETYAERTAKGRDLQRRLFVEDAAQGLGFIDLCARQYDAVLMNPPFGDSSTGARDYIDSRYAAGSSDLGAAFVLRWLQALAPGGRLGAITNRTLLAVQRFAAWREQVIDNAGLHVLVDLGHGVLDAMVETAMYVCGGAPHSQTRSPSAFLGLLESGDKGHGLELAFRDAGRLDWRNAVDFSAVPGTPWAYWVPSDLLRRFKTDESFLSAGGLVCQGPATANDFRFYRLRWEVPSREVHSTPHQSDQEFHQHIWSLVAKGGEYSLWWDDIHLVVNWAADGAAPKAYIVQRYSYLNGNWGWVAKNTEKLFLRGATYPYRTTSGFGLRLLPPGASFSVGGWAVFSPEDWSDEDILAIYNTRVVRYFMEVLLGQGDSSASGTAARNHVSAAVGGVPWPRGSVAHAAPLVGHLVDLAATRSFDETTLFFSGRINFRDEPSSFGGLLAEWWNTQCDTWLEVASTYAEIEQAVLDAYGLTEEDLDAIDDAEGSPLASYPKRYLDPDDVSELFRASVEELTARARAACGAKRYIVKKAYFVQRAVDLGCHIFSVHPESIIEAARSAGAAKCGADRAFAARLLSWMVGVAVGSRTPQHAAPKGPSVLAALPPRGIEESDAHFDVWVDDDGHPRDFVALVLGAAAEYWRENGCQIVRDAAARVIREGDLRSWYREYFFARHISAYSKSRRKAPVYWQLSTLSGSYSVWLYYQHVTRDTLYGVLNDYIAPKLKHEGRRLANLAQEAGPNQSSGRRNALAEQENLIQELRTFHEEVARVAPLWNPNLNDGVIINFAPLWRLVRQNRSWQKECKKVWDKLVAGEYDWAHLAMHLWPERVVPKCAKDRSLAIAHGLEDVFWYEDSDGKWQPRKIDQAEIAKVIKDGTSAAVKDALKSLLKAPASATGRSSRKKAPRAMGSGRKTASAPPKAAANGASSSSRSSATVDAEALGKITEAIGANGDGASKADVIAATGVTTSEWNKAIKFLLADGSVTQTGERRGARYHLRGGDA